MTAVSTVAAAAVVAGRRYWTVPPGRLRPSARSAKPYWMDCGSSTVVRSSLHAAATPRAPSAAIAAARLRVARLIDLPPAAWARCARPWLAG